MPSSARLVPTSATKFSGTLTTPECSLPYRYECFDDREADGRSRARTSAATSAAPGIDGGALVWRASQMPAPATPSPAGATQARNPRREIVRPPIRGTTPVNLAVQGLSRSLTLRCDRAIVRAE